MSLETEEILVVLEALRPGKLLQSVSPGTGEALVVLEAMTRETLVVFEAMRPGKRLRSLSRDRGSTNVSML